MKKKVIIEKENVDLKLDAIAARMFEFLEGKKASDVVLLDLESVNSYFKYFIIATATSHVHLKSLFRDLSQEFSKEKTMIGSAPRPVDVESGWVILDYVDIVVHLFTEEKRNYYNLERVWGDARRVLESGEK